MFLRMSFRFLVSVDTNRCWDRVLVPLSSFGLACQSLRHRPSCCISYFSFTRSEKLFCTRNSVQVLGVQSPSTLANTSHVSKCKRKITTKPASAVLRGSCLTQQQVLVTVCFCFTLVPCVK